ncbi:MAG: hypothetical protein ABIN24_09180 [Dyadobacter sp.]
MARRLLASLVLLIYLWMAGMGCISRPDEVPYMMVVEKSYTENNRFEERRYMRMDGLEVLMAEVMDTHYNNSPDQGGHIDISLTSAIDCHFASECLRINIPPTFNSISNSYAHFIEIPISGIPFSIFAPPRHAATV